MDKSYLDDPSLWDTLLKYIEDGRDLTMLSLVNRRLAFEVIPKSHYFILHFSGLHPPKITVPTKIMPRLTHFEVSVSSFAIKRGLKANLAHLPCCLKTLVLFFTGSFDSISERCPIMSQRSNDNLYQLINLNNRFPHLNRLEIFDGNDHQRHTIIDIFANLPKKLEIFRHNARSVKWHSSAKSAFRYPMMSIYWLPSTLKVLDICIATRIYNPQAYLRKHSILVDHGKVLQPELKEPNSFAFPPKLTHLQLDVEDYFNENICYTVEFMIRGTDKHQIMPWTLIRENFHRRKWSLDGHLLNTGLPYSLKSLVITGSSILNIFSIDEIKKVKGRNLRIVHFDFLPRKIHTLKLKTTDFALTVHALPNSLTYLGLEHMDLNHATKLPKELKTLKILKPVHGSNSEYLWKNFPRTIECVSPNILKTMGTGSFIVAPSGFKKLNVSEITADRLSSSNMLRIELPQLESLTLAEMDEEIVEVFHPKLKTLRVLGKVQQFNSRYLPRSLTELVLPNLKLFGGSSFLRGLTSKICLVSLCVGGQIDAFAVSHLPESITQLEFHMLQQPNRDVSRELLPAEKATTRYRWPPYLKFLRTGISVSPNKSLNRWIFSLLRALPESLIHLVLLFSEHEEPMKIPDPAFGNFWNLSSGLTNTPLSEGFLHESKPNQHFTASLCMTDGSWRDVAQAQTQTESDLASVDPSSSSSAHSTIPPTTMTTKSSLSFPNAAIKVSSDNAAPAIVFDGLMIFSSIPTKHLKTLWIRNWPVPIHDMHLELLPPKLQHFELQLSPKCPAQFAAYSLFGLSTLPRTLTALSLPSAIQIPQGVVIPPELKRSLPQRILFLQIGAAVWNHATLLDSEVLPLLDPKSIGALVSHHISYLCELVSPKPATPVPVQSATPPASGIPSSFPSSSKTSTVYPPSSLSMADSSSSTVASTNTGKQPSENRKAGGQRNNSRSRRNNKK